MHIYTLLGHLGVAFSSLLAGNPPGRRRMNQNETIFLVPTLVCAHFLQSAERFLLIHLN